MGEKDRIVIDDRDHTIRRPGEVDVRRFCRQDDRVRAFMYKVTMDLSSTSSDGEMRPGSGKTLFYPGSSQVFMRSFIKIMGPPLLEAVRELERIAVDMPQVCVMDEAILLDIPRRMARDIGEPIDYPEYVSEFFSRRTGVRVKTERCSSIISKSGEELGEYDFFFEWFEEPSMEQLTELIGKIDGALGSLGCLYSITTKK